MVPSRMTARKYCMVRISITTPPSYSILAWEDIRNKYLIIGNSAGKISSEGRDALKEDLKMSYGYITKLNENVIREHVRYNNRYGIAIVADLYRAKDLDETKEYPAL